MKESVMSAGQIFDNISELAKNVKDTKAALDQVAKEIGAGSQAFVIVEKAYLFAQGEYNRARMKTYQSI